MRCPECGTDDCYTGLQWVHCKNSDCKYYDARYASKLREEKRDERRERSAYDVCIDNKVEKLILLRGKVDDSKKPPKRP